MDFTLFFVCAFYHGFFIGAPRRFSPCRFRHGGEGIGKGNDVSLSLSAKVRNPFRNAIFSAFFQAHRAAFLPAVSGIVGKGLERETLLPFPRLRRFGTHCETGSKFLLLFSIKSKKESFCLAKIVLNWRISDVVQAKYLARMSPIGACAANLDAPAPLFHSPKS